MKGVRGIRLLASLALALLISCTPLAQTSYPASGSIDVAFTPWDDAEGALLKVLKEAKHEIYVQAYLFTSRNLARGLIEAANRGVKVEILADQEMLLRGENSQIPQLARMGIPVWLETRYAVAHNKIMLIDPQETGGVVVTGSYNFTYSAQARNAENLLILRNNPELMQAYLKNWQRHRSEALPYVSEASQENAASEKKKNVKEHDGL